MIRRLYKKFRINILFYHIKKFYWGILNLIFMKILNKNDFRINISNQKIIVLRENLLSFKNKPIWLRLKDNTYEKEEIFSILKYLKKNMKVLELGGSIGVTSVLINSILTNKEFHIVCEPNTSLIPNLKLNRELNNSKFKIINQPVSSKEAKKYFYYNNLSLSGSLLKLDENYDESRHGKLRAVETKTITPKILEKKYDIKFDCLVCDIEGEEYVLLKDQKAYFQNFKILIIEFHFNFSNSDILFDEIRNIYSDKFIFKMITYNNYVLINKSTTKNDF
jgi:FkbM family methyltransferase